MSKSPSKAQVNVRKHFSSSILLWVRTVQPRQTGMDYWKGPHSKIISATPGSGGVPALAFGSYGHLQVFQVRMAPSAG